MQQQQDRKRRFPATSKSSPVVLSGEITVGGGWGWGWVVDGGGVVFFFAPMLSYPCFLCPPVPSSALPAAR